MPNKRDLGSLVTGAGDDITPPGPLRRGGGLSSMIGGSDPPPAPPPASRQVDLSTSPQADPIPPRSSAPATPARKVASYRIDPELARRVKIYAAMYDLNDYEVVERALTDYLARHSSGPGAE